MTYLDDVNYHPVWNTQHQPLHCAHCPLEIIDER